jgi:hypothetical protein
MSKNRILYNSQALYVSQVDATGMQLGTDIKQLYNIQSFDLNNNHNFTDINELGNLTSRNRFETKNPDITANFSYFITNGENERFIGLNIGRSGTRSENLPSAISGFIVRSGDEKNYYLGITEAGNDANCSIGGYTIGGYLVIGGYDVNIANQYQNESINNVIGLGNGYLTSYTVNASIGEIPTAEIGIQGLNIQTYTDIKAKEFFLRKYTLKDTPLIGGYAQDDFGRVVEITNSKLIISNQRISLFGGINSGAVYFYNINESTPFSTIGGYNYIDNRVEPRFGNSVDVNNNFSWMAAGSADRLFITNLISTAASGGIIAGYTTQRFLSIGTDNEFGADVAINKELASLIGGYVRVAAISRNRLSIFTGVRIGTFEEYQRIFPPGATRLENIAASDDLSIIAVGGGKTLYIYTGVQASTSIQNWVLCQQISDNNAESDLYTNKSGSIFVIGGYGAPGISIYTGNPISKWSLKQTISNGGQAYLDRNGTFIASSIGFSNQRNPRTTNIYSGNSVSGWSFFQNINTDTTEEGTWGLGFLKNVAIEYPNMAIGTWPYIFPDRVASPLADVSEVQVFEINNYDGLLPSVRTRNEKSFEYDFFKLPSRLTINPKIRALSPGDILFQIPSGGTLGFSEIDLKVQDFKLSLNIPRTPLYKIGEKFPFYLDLNFPINVTLEVNAVIGDLNSGNLEEIICNESEKEFFISIYEPSCNIRKQSAITYILRGAKLTSQNFTSEIGGNSIMNAIYELPISNPNDTRGLFISGSFV